MDVDAAPVGQIVQVVDPEVRAYVYSLVTALGGFNGEDASKYCLGDDALACLRDIKKWLKLYDEKTNRMDVARCLGEANLVNGDLLPILSLWWESGQNNKHLSRIALACLELLVPLTWPVEVHGQMTVNHHRHTPYLQQAQVLYKRGILSNHNGVGILRAVIRIGLPSMAIPRSERTARDEGILKLVLYLFRNVAIITPSARLAAEGDEEETSRSATINAFQEQDVFALLLTMCSNVGEDFSFQDVIILEILFHLVKGVDVEKLFMDDAQRSVKRKDELGDLLKKEASLKREYAKNAPTRHGRFGTMIWVKRDDAKVSTVSGQEILKDSQATLHKMDQTKKWNRPKPRRRVEVEASSNDFNTPTHLTSAATKNLRTFVEEFLDSGFNPLFTHVRKAIEREADRVLDINTRQFFYLVAWFLEAERVRRRRQREQHEKNKGTSKEIDPDSFSLVAGVLNQETFVFLNRAMQHSFDNKDWQDLNATMRCFTQILLTVQEMSWSPLEEDQEIAENIQNRIFYEETTHDRVVSIVRGYKDQGFGYLDACTELAHVFLRMLENYSKQNVDMQVRSRRRARRKKQPEKSTDDNDEENDEEQDSAAEDLVDAARVSKERKFDFSRFAAKFCNQKAVDTFVAFTHFYRDLNDEQLKRAHRFFYRIAFKQEMSVLLFRVDIMNLFYRMIKGPGALDSSKPIFREWEEFVRRLIRKLIKKIEQRPELITEMLFSKINSTLYYLEYGHEKQTISTGTRPPAELEVHPRAATTWDEKLAIVVAALVMDGRADLAKWISDVLDSAANERSSWEAGDEARRAESPDAFVAPNPMIEVKPPDDTIRTAMFRNARLRLLMTLAGFERLGAEDVLGASWVVPSALRSSELRDIKAVIDKNIENPVSEVNGEDPRQQLRRKHTGESREAHRQTTLDVNFGSDSEGEDNVPDGPLFPPNIRTRSNALEGLKKTRRKRRQADDEEKEPLDEAVLEERRRKREEKARAREAKIKSDLFIHASDEETDEEADSEFFRREEETRKAQAQRSVDAPPRWTWTGTNDSDDDIQMMTSLMRSPSPRPASTSQGDAEEDTPPTSAEDDLDFDDNLAFNKHRYQESVGIEKTAPAGSGAGSDNEDDADVPVAAPSRRRMRAGFVLDSDSE
ncbi:DNA repair protein (Tof1) [Rasamsonia emersonii CBS 393.64]|uniref:Topoisomerase 1-associated factor 1 n=1 Tax=Rasamsonia emersonii (strain ATCC 16479 / CBS 393.64 / IMI 116815) TaxID=1408163 RepID=A0A0F4YUX1_RASE3|nr:DNA repair protein (Tof1) [Rasamsonia emersonii CBS 393.64]KKA22034.1 DNA repair protein (Tof1) [Rasamsonia emersonii CBS 393.64]